MATGDLTQKQMIKLITECGDDISAAQVSYWKKDELRNALKVLKKTIDDKEKTRKTAVINEVVESAKTLLNANPNLPFLVHEFKAFSENKALDGAFKQVKALSPSKYYIYRFSCLFLNLRRRYRHSCIIINLLYLISGTPAMFLSTDEDNNKIMCRADVPKDIVKSKGLDAREWCDQVKELIGGKGMSSLLGHLQNLEII